MIGMCARFASLTAIESSVGSTMKSAPGSRVMFRSPPKPRSMRLYLRVRSMRSFFERSDSSIAITCCSSSCMKTTRLEIVVQLVSVPPSQRSVTCGMPQRSASVWMMSRACRLVPTKSTICPAETTSRILSSAASSR